MISYTELDEQRGQVSPMSALAIGTHGEGLAQAKPASEDLFCSPYLGYEPGWAYE
jgi:hypothetical protein